MDLLTYLLDSDAADGGGGIGAIRILISRIHSLTAVLIALPYLYF